MKGKAPKSTPRFSGPNGFWKWWRQSVQIAFYAAQALLLIQVLGDAAVTKEMLPVAPDRVEVAAGTPFKERFVTWVSSSLSKERLVPWTMGLAGNLVAPIPGEFAQEKIVWPMFMRPKLGLAFVLVFPLCFFLGMVGRLRQKAIDSNAWRHVKVV